MPATFRLLKAKLKMITRCCPQDSKSIYTYVNKYNIYIYTHIYNYLVLEAKVFEKDILWALKQIHGVFWKYSRKMFKTFIALLRFQKPIRMLLAASGYVGPYSRLGCLHMQHGSFQHFGACMVRGSYLS